MAKKITDLSRRNFLKKSGVAVGGLMTTPLVNNQATAATADDRIVSAKIHPAIGIARIGNSPEHFIGPEVIEPPAPDTKNKVHDAQGRLKRQAARFRVYGYNAAGQPVRELTAVEAKITWQVQLANKKGAWYRFIVAMDLEEASGLSVIRRNASEPDRKRLIIAPQARTISGVGRNGIALTGGKFLDTAVDLGELRTDSDGRLLVLSGLGKADSPGKMPVYDPNPGQEDTFNNADGWYDDTADGPVRATVIFNGKELATESAWVAVAPPNYAPEIIGWRTLYDLIMDAHIDAKLLAPPATSSFMNDILPVLRRLSNLQWVNRGFANLFGKGGTMDFESPRFVQPLSVSGIVPAGLSLRNEVYKLLRMSTGSLDPRDPSLWPRMYGDAYGFKKDSKHINFIVNGVTALHLERWAKGDFINDWTETSVREARLLATMQPELQPAMLDRAALHYCLADAFHPGCELTWPMRHISMYKPLVPGHPISFRIKERKAGESERDLGELLTRESALAENGPLYEQGPGDLTRWMAVPWQGDTVHCRSGYEWTIDPITPTYWPARVPNHILTEEDYKFVMDTVNNDRNQRLARLQKREHWMRSMKGDPVEQMMQMVKEFGQMGVIEARPGIVGDQDFPAVMFVEILPHDPLKATPPVSASGRSGPTPAPSGPPDPVREAGFENEEQARKFRRVRGLK